MKKVSIVVPCYNAVQYLDRCIDSLVNQTIGIENLEIILVDDASTDDGQTWTRIVETERRFPDSVMAVSLSENLRQGGARNVGISYAGGEYLMFCDADDWLALEAAECLYQRAKNYDTDVIEYRMQKVQDDTDLSTISTAEGKRSGLLLLDREEIKKAFYLTHLEECSLGCMRKFYRMSLIKENQIRFVEHLICEEPSFTVPVRLYEQRHYQLDKILYYYYMSPHSTSRGGWDERKLDNIQVWKALMADLQERGFVQKYHDEMEYLFYDWGYTLSVRMLLLRGYTISVEEMQILVRELLTLFPGVRENPYLQETSETFFQLLKVVLDMKLTPESGRTMHDVLRKYLC